MILQQVTFLQSNSLRRGDSIPPASLSYFTLQYKGQVSLWNYKA